MDDALKGKWISFATLLIQMLVITRILGFGNRTGLSEPEKAKIWLKLSEINGQRTQIYARNQQIEQCEASGETEKCL